MPNGYQPLVVHNADALEYFLTHSEEDFLVRYDQTILRMGFTGFTFNGHHSEEFNIYRVSSGSRYTDNLSPTIKDTTAEAVGADGMFYFGSYYKQRQFSLSVAFCHVTEQQLRAIKQWLNTRAPSELIFDESPYIAYDAKVSSPPQFKYLCFLENGQRIYKGEGTIVFTAYTPFGHNPNGLDCQSDYSLEQYPNRAEWWATAALPEHRVVQIDTNSFSCINCGDLPTPFIATFTVQSGVEHSIHIGSHILNIRYSSISDTSQLTWDSMTGLITTENGTVVNNSIISGKTIAQVPVGEFTATGIDQIDFQYRYY